MLAILEYAVASFQKYIFAHDGEGKAKFHETEDWILEKNSEWIFSFVNICEVLGFNPIYVRQGLLRWKEMKLTKRFKSKNGRDNVVLAVDTERQEERCCPVEIAHLKEFEFLRIVWNDGHLSDYPLAILRSYCSCSVCGGHGDYSRFERKDSLMPVISTIGDAILRIGWANGHHTSDYSFTFLRSLCSCHVCQARKMLGG